VRSDLVLLVAGLALLAWAADAFVDGAAGLALSLRLSPVVVGAVVIGFGTSAPELVVSVLAAAGGSLDIVAVGTALPELATGGPGGPARADRPVRRQCPRE